MDFVTLEDNQDYLIVDTIDNYLYLVSEQDPTKLCIRKLKQESSKKYITGLDSDKEFDKALLLFTKKHKDDIEM